MPTGLDLDNLISVIVPCRNERQHIDAFCDSALRQQLPVGWRMEVLIADGDSDDGTREHLMQRCAADPRLVLVDNPGRIVSTGLNACIARARGGTIARMDVHSQFAPDYLAQCIEALERTSADNVGGPWRAATCGCRSRRWPWHLRCGCCGRWWWCTCRQRAFATAPISCSG